ncbi:hypothetical protein HYS31_05010 [Candidatus Woesearchaeota archaeon]|nr:hypothetical protein [Candidatus Woesearchaeota archaeon]
MEKEEVDELIRILNKALQGYRLRSKILQKRYDIIRLIFGKYRNSPSEKEFFQSISAEASQLKRLLRHEKKILAIIQSGEDEEENILLMAIGQLKISLGSLGASSAKLKKNLESYGLDINILSTYIEDAIAVLEKLNQDIKNIERRIAAEEHFFGNPGKKSFDNFAKEFNMEIIYNKRLFEDVAAFRKIEKKKVDKIMAGIAYFRDLSDYMNTEGAKAAGFFAQSYQVFVEARTNVKYAATFYFIYQIMIFTIEYFKELEEESTQYVIYQNEMISRFKKYRAKRRWWNFF